MINLSDNKKPMRPEQNPTDSPMVLERSKERNLLTHLSLASLLWDIGKQHSPRCDAAERGVPPATILFAKRIFIEKLNKI